MPADAGSDSRELRIPARLRHVSAVRRFVQELARESDLDDQEVADLLLAVSEACNNAIQHGARHLPSAEIAIRAYIDHGAVCVEVRDPGPGFDPGDLWEPDSETAHGRGMLLILQLTDTVEYFSDGRGTTVRLTKRPARARVADEAEAPGSLRAAVRRHSRLMTLFEVCRAVSSTLELPEVLRVVAEQTARLFGVARVRVLLHDPRHQTATVAASWGERLKVRPGQGGAPPAPQAVYVAADPSSGATAAVGQLRGAAPPAEQPTSAHDASSRPATGSTPPLRSSISVPITSRGEVVGSIHLDNSERPLRLFKADVVALRAIAAQAAVAIENARLYREAHRHVEELFGLSEVARSLNASLDLDQLLKTILDKTRELLGVEACAVMLLDDEGYLSVRASYGMSEAYVAHQRALLEESPLARAISERRVIAAWDLRPYDIPRGLNEGIVSAAAAPMVLNDRPIGTLNIYTRERYRFTEDQLRTLGALATHAALAVYNARLYEVSERSRAELEATLARSGSALDGTTEPQEAVRLVAELAAQALGMDGGAVVLTDADILVGGGPGTRQAGLAILTGLRAAAQHAAKLGRPVTLADLQETPAGETLREAGISTCLAVPLTVPSGPTGALCVFSRSPRDVGTRGASLLSSFAAQAAMVVENQRLLHDTHRRAEELGTLLEIGQSIASKLDLDSVLDRIIEHVSRTTECEVCSILLVDRHSGDLFVAASRGLEPRHARRLRMDRGEGVIGAVLRDGQTRAVSDIRRHSDFFYQDVQEHQRLRALLCVPLRTPTEVLGVLNVYRSDAHAWTDAEVKFLGALSAQAAIAIQNATLYQQERQMAQALQKAFVPATPPALAGLDIGQVYVPASEEAEVGGDYYDFIPLDRGRLGIVIADVSGKGLRAATGTAMGKYILRAYVVENPSPGEVARRTNNALCRHFVEESAFLTLVYALWDPRTRHLTYVNAGHPYPLLYRHELDHCIPLRSPQTMLLGILPDQTFAEQRLLIAPGDVLLAYTDGVTEARRGSEQFGMERIAEALRASADQPAQATASSIYRSVCEFRDDRRVDDITLVVVKFLPTR